MTPDDPRDFDDENFFVYLRRTTLAVTRIAWLTICAAPVTR